MGQKVTVTTRSRTRKVPSGNVKCNVCGGKGYHKAPTRKSGGRRK